MTIAQITEDNIFQYTELIPAELRSDLTREYFRGLAAHDSDGNPNAAIVWELKSLEDENVPTSAEILCFEVSDKEVGEQLLKAFEQNIKDDGALLVTFEMESIGEIPRTILSDSGYKLKETDSRDITVTVSELAGLKLGEKKVPNYITSLSEITSRQFKAAIMTSVFHGRYGLLDDLPFLPVTRFDPDVSSCAITDDKVGGLLLVHKSMNGSYIVELFFAVQPDANINLLHMMRYSIRAAARLCDMDDRVLLRAHNKESKLLVKKLFPNKKGTRIIRGEKITVQK